MALTRVISAASTNATLIKAGRTKLRKAIVSNGTTTMHHVRLYDKATAPTVGTDASVMSLATGGATGGGPYVFNFEPGVDFFNGLALSITSGANSAADSDATVAAANAVVVHLIYGD